MILIVVRSIFIHISFQHMLAGIPLVDLVNGTKYNAVFCLLTGGRQGKLPCLAFEVYDFFDEKWRKLPDVPSKRVFAMYAATEKHIVSLGGLMQPGNKGFSDACEVFDLETGKKHLSKVSNILTRNKAILQIFIWLSHVLQYAVVINKHFGLLGFMHFDEN